MFKSDIYVSLRALASRALCTSLLLIFALPASAQLWSETGEVVEEDILEWQQANTRDKVATTGFFLEGLRVTGNMEPEMSARILGDRDLQPLAEILAMCIDGLTPIEADPEQNKATYAGKDVSAFAASCILDLGWAKPGI